MKQQVFYCVRDSWKKKMEEKDGQMGMLVHLMAGVAENYCEDSAETSFLPELDYAEERTTNL